MSFLAGVICGALLVGFMPAGMVTALDNLRIAILGRVTAVGAKFKPAPAAPRPLMGIPLPFGFPWKLVLCVAIVAIVLGGLHFFGQSRYDQGVSDERAVWVANGAAVQSKVTELTANITQENARIRNNLDDAFDLANEQLEAANNAEARVFLGVWRSVDFSLCDAAGGCAG